jgi:hypothetical protein
MKLAHLILPYDRPQQLLRLVKRLSHPDADVYIHLDKKSDITLFDAVKVLPNTFFIKNRAKVMWGDFGAVQAELNGLEEILATGIDYSHINFLSGQDYPLRSAGHIQEFLFSNTGKTFMWYGLIPDDWPHGQVRMQNYDLGSFGFPGRFHVAGLMNKVLPKRKLPENLKPYGRSQWLTITPAAAEYVIKYIKDHPAVKRFFKMTWASDEVFFQTILCNSPLKDTIVNDNLRYIRLLPDFRPAVYTIADAAVLTSSGKFYARKFDMNIDSVIFDYLDNQSVLQ